eukprot:TRINITY_DN64754_c0_g1_i1.p1 TRINITY_DN64754_c0_g1~~TRINITY_DN64754_c0_g1_i1.p1  ORF type:complete len:350 (+),score=20.34 TRINITY_DN64754_c0_g1_i1:99-1148(+)
MGNPFAFELRGFRDQSLNGIYVIQEAAEYLTLSGRNRYPTYWNSESSHERPFFMYWQENKGRHAITPRFDRSRRDLPSNDLFVAVADGHEQPGLAFYRPCQNEWYEYDLTAQQWIPHPQNQNILYVPHTRESVLSTRAASSSSRRVEPVVAPSSALRSVFRSAPRTPQCVPAAATPGMVHAPGTPSYMMPGTLGGFAPAPGTPQGMLGPAPGTPRGPPQPSSPTVFSSAIASASHESETLSSRRSRLELAKKRAIESEDFDLAKVLKEQLAALATEEAQAQDLNVGECCICLQEVQTFFTCIPCGHACVCELCSQSLAGQPCPICRTTVERMNVTHLSFRRPAKVRRRE